MSTPWINRAYRLAEEITWLHAKALADIDRGQRGARLTRKQRVILHYDPHAATELGSLICERLSPEDRP